MTYNTQVLLGKKYLVHLIDKDDESNFLPYCKLYTNKIWTYKSCCYAER